MAIHCESKKLDPFLFEHNFGKYCLILIILSLLQREINYDTVYHKIYHHTSNLLVHIKEVSKRYHQNFLLCNNNEITASIADLFNSFCEEVYAVAFFKVMHQQTVGKVENSLIIIQLYICGHVISVCNSERLTKIGHYV